MPTTGRTGEHEGDEVRAGSGEKHLVEITVAIDSGVSGKITSTDEHPFWVPSENR